MVAIRACTVIELLHGSNVSIACVTVVSEATSSLLVDGGVWLHDPVAGRQQGSWRHMCPAPGKSALYPRVCCGRMQACAPH